MKYNTKEILGVAGIYMSFNVGAGFTSGQEIIQFFSGFGWYSIWGAVISLCIIIYGAESLIDAGWNNRKDPLVSVFNYFGGNLVGNIYNIVIPVVIYTTYITMVAGGGSVLEEYFYLPNVLGRLFIIVLTIISIFFKFTHIAKLISYIGRIIAFIIVVVSGIAVVIGFKNITFINEYVSLYPLHTAGDTFYGAGILYASAIVLLSAQFLFELGKHLTQRNSGYYGIVLGTTFYILAGMIVNFAILLHMPYVYSLKIITIYFTNLLSHQLSFIVSILLFLAMYAGSTTCLWSVGNIIRKKFHLWKKRYLSIILCLGILGMVLSSVSFVVLVNFLYPIIGFCGIFFIVLIIIHNRKGSYSLYR